MTRPVADVVAQLNTWSADIIHQVLAVEGIKGKRSETTCCPIANYVHHETDVRVQVGTEILNELRQEGDRTLAKSHTLSFQVGEFITRFDRGEFSDLLA